MPNLKFSLTIVVATFACAAHGAAPTLSEKSFTPAVERYLQKKGDFCLGKFDWPIAVSATERRAGSNNALQMPVLEKLGLVAASTDAGDPAVKQYALTERGKKYYIVKKTVTLGPGNVPVDHPGDFCVAKLKLDKLVSWLPIEVVDGTTQTTVKYTYQVAAAADWAHDTEIQKVFPMIHKIVDGAGQMQMMQVLAWKDRAWVAVTPGD